MKRILLLAALTSIAHTQEVTDVVKPGQGAKLALPAVQGAKPAGKAPKRKGGPTIITSREASFLSNAQTAEFKGEVTVKGPDFDIVCDHLKIIMKPKPAAPVEGAAPAPVPAPAAAPAPAGALGGNIEEAIATGDVIITQDRPGKPGEPPKRYLAKGKKAVFTAKNGMLVLTGWPQIIETTEGKPAQQTNALEEGTKVFLFQSNDMKVEGLSEFIFHGKEEK